MNLYLFSLTAVQNPKTDENTLILNFTEQTERALITRPGSGANVVISDEVPLIFAPFMPIDAVITFFRQIAAHLENQVTEQRNAVTIPTNGD